MNEEELEDFKLMYGEDFAEEVNDLLEDLNEHRDWPWGRQYNFWASDAGQFCRREMFLKMWGFPKSNARVTNKSQAKFGFGNKYEELVVEKYKRITPQLWLQAGGAWKIPGLEPEIEYAMAAYGADFANMFAPRISYKIDMVLDDVHCVLDDEVKRYVVEVKGTADFPFKDHYKSAKSDRKPIYGVVTAPKDGNFLQTHQYMTFEEIDQGLLHYGDFNDGSEHIWYLDRDDDLVERAVVEPYREAYRAYVYRKMPDRDYNAKISKDGKRLLKSDTHWRCEYCGYASMCWGVDGYEPLETIEQLWPDEEVEAGA